MSRYLIVALGGALGAACRYALSGLAYRIIGVGFPWGTLVVNVSGCFFFGFLWSRAVERGAMGPEARALLLTGFAGALTTFSTYAHETIAQIRDGDTGAAFCNLLANNGGGLVAFWIALRLGQLF